MTDSLDMPNLYEEDIPVKSPETTIEEEMEIRKLLEYTDAKRNPWHESYVQTITECYNFKELRQWSQEDLQALLAYDVPAIPADRIGRNLDNIRGIRENTKNKPKIVPKNTGSKNVAELLDATCVFAEEQGDAAAVQDDAFDGLIDIGVGLSKLGYDPALDNGQGAIWFDTVNVEACGWSYMRKKDFSKLRWIWEEMVMGWEDAITLAPGKAGELNSLKATMAQPWEKYKSGVSTPVSRDYGVNNVAQGEPRFTYPDQVKVYEIWTKRIIPFRKVLAPVMQPVTDQFGPVPHPETGEPMMQQAMRPLSDNMGNGITGPDGMPAMVPHVQVKQVPIDYKAQGMEIDLGPSVQEQWYQHLIATGSAESNKGSSAILLTPLGGLPSKYGWHPYGPMIAEFKKSGQPRGFIEIAIPHQQRINMALAQKIAYNNKSLKSPIIIESSGGSIDVDSMIQQSKIGAVFIIEKGSKLIGVNTNLPTNLQAIEEGNIARADMDFAAAASEPVMLGAAAAGDSGLKVAKQQDAAITPLNKYVKAERKYLEIMRRKVLHIVIAEYSPQRMMQIVGQETFMRLVPPTPDPMTGLVVNPGIQFPITPSVEEYDVDVEDTGTTDFKKQQQFNAVMTLLQDGIPLTNETVIRSAPAPNTDELLESNREAKNDMIAQMQMQIQQLETELQLAFSLIPRELKLTALSQLPLAGGGNKKAQKKPGNNANRGRAQSQAGPRSMMGGQLGMPG